MKTEGRGETENKNKKNKINDLIYTICPILRVANCFGIFRFRITDGELLPTDRKMKLTGILITMTYITVFSFLLKLPADVDETRNLLDIMENVPSIVILIQYVTSAFATSFFLTRNNINIFTAFSNIDATLHINTNQDFYEKSRIRCFKFLGALTAYHLFVSTSDLCTDEEITINKLIVLPLYYEENLEILVFCLMINMLKCRLTVINNYLTKFMNDKESTRAAVFIVGERKPNPDNSFNLIGRMSIKNMKIRDMAATYDAIGETCLLINKVFNYQIFMTLVSTFTYIVITIWSSLYYFRSNEAISGSMITIIIWCITATLKVAVMSLVCERLLLTRNKTKILVNKVIMDYDLPKTMRVQAKAFMDLIEAWPLRVFIYDMFSVDITLMLKYISVATTYLIVIIQVSHFA
ncbi:uncharacterized protein LOC128671860 [Plodia interpunctella]|uniref:uncharacterized protein LOC128671860 n=1 Tax=Plodia interpunctella TaxID=58824 RepID=UPI0023679AD2|nr:uncharacterized protein LOC128671860 [Plodia interpunctella]